jgi:hypothetical protein
VVLDHLVADLLGPVGIDAERRDAEGPPQRLPLELSEARQGLDLVEPDNGEGLAQMGAATRSQVRIQTREIVASAI